MTTPFGHSFCGFCVTQFKKTTSQLTCAMCRQQVDNFCKNIFVYKVLSTFLTCKDHFSLDSCSAEHIKKCAGSMSFVWREFETPISSCARGRMHHGRNCVRKTRSAATLPTDVTSLKCLVPWQMIERYVEFHIELR